MSSNTRTAFTALNTEIAERLAALEFNTARRLIDVVEALVQIDPMIGCITPREASILSAEGLIPAIKAVRERTGLGLKETKDLLDGYIARTGSVRHETPGGYSTYKVPAK